MQQCGMQADTITSLHLSAEHGSVEVPRASVHAVHCSQEKSPMAVARVYKTTVPPLTKDCASVDGRFQVRQILLLISNDTYVCVLCTKDYTIQPIMGADRSPMPCAARLLASLLCDCTPLSVGLSSSCSLCLSHASSEARYQMYSIERGPRVVCVAHSAYSLRQICSKASM